MKWLIDWPDSQMLLVNENSASELSFAGKAWVSLSSSVQYTDYCCRQSIA